MDITELLTAAVKAGTSDLHLRSGSDPIMRVHGELCPLVEDHRLDTTTLEKMTAGLLPAALQLSTNPDELTLRLQSVTSITGTAHDAMAQARPGGGDEPPAVTRFGD